MPGLVAKPVILGILFSISVILAFKFVFLTNLLESGILFSTAANSFLVARHTCIDVSIVNNFIVLSPSELSLSYAVFKTIFLVSVLSIFVTNSSYTVFLTTSFFTILLSLDKSLGTNVNLSISGLYTSAFKLAKFDFSAKPLTSNY